MNKISKTIGGICMLLGSVAAAATPEQVCEASKTKAIDVQFQGPIGAGSAEKHVPAYVRAVRGARCD